MRMVAADTDKVENRRKNGNQDQQGNQGIRGKRFLVEEIAERTVNCGYRNRGIIKPHCRVIQAELIFGDQNGHQGRRVAEKNKDRDRSHNTQDLAQHKGTARHRLGHQQENRSVLHLAADRVCGADHRHNKAENKSRRHGAVHHQLDLFAEDKHRRRRKQPDHNQRAGKHQKINRLTDTLDKGVSGKFVNNQHL